MVQNEERSEIDMVSSYLRENQKEPAAEEQTDTSEKRIGRGDINLSAERRALLRHHQAPPYYAQLPDGLVSTKRVSPDAKVVYALLHKHAPIKNLNRMPVVEVSQELLADEMGRTEETIRSLIKQLVDEGWIGKYRQGKMKVNRYVLYPRSKRTWQAYVAMERVQIKIQRDDSLARRLRESLYPQTDHKESCDHSSEQKISVSKVTTSARGAY